MKSILTSLEPRFVEKGVELIRELDEFTEVYFFNRGVYEIGFEINHKTYIILQYKNSNVIGAYGLTYNVRALFKYQTASKCAGYSIRKSNWFDILNDNELIMNTVKDSVKQDYEAYVKKKCLIAKKEIIKKW